MWITSGKSQKWHVKSFYENIYPVAWNQYEFRSRSRDKVEKKIEILLILSGVLTSILVSHQLSNSTYKNDFIWGSIFLLALIFLISLYEFVIPRKSKRFWFPSVEKHQMDAYKKNNDIDGFYKQIVEECYEMEGKVNEYVKGRTMLIRLLTFTLLLSVYLPIAYEIYTNYVFFFTGSLVGFVVLLIMFYRASSE